MEAATAELKNANGATDGGVPLEGEEPGEEVAVREEVVIEGDGQITLAIGGKKPTNSKVVLRGGQIPMNGERKKGDYLTLEVRARVGEIHIIDKVDSNTDEVVETTRKHVLKVEGVQIVED